MTCPGQIPVRARERPNPFLPSHPSPLFRKAFARRPSETAATPVELVSAVQEGEPGNRHHGPSWTDVARLTADNLAQRTARPPRARDAVKTPRLLKFSATPEDTIFPCEREESRNCRDPYYRQKQLDGVSNSGARPSRGINRAREIIQAINAINGVHACNPYASARNQRDGKKPITFRVHPSPPFLVWPRLAGSAFVSSTSTRATTSSTLFVVMKPDSARRPS